MIAGLPPGAVGATLEEKFAATASKLSGEAEAEAARALKHDLDRSGPGSQGSGRPLVSNELGLARDNMISDLEGSRWSWVWSDRPRFLYLALFFAAYVLGCGFAQSLAIVPGTGISIWPPAGLFIATLVLASRHSWPWWVLAGCLAELFGNFLWFHSPLPAAFLIYVGNALEAIAGAWLVNRFCRRPVQLETLQEVLAFVVLAAGIAPVISATVGSATLALFAIQSQSFASAWPLWWIGDATGVLIVAPPALVVFQNWRGKARLSAARWMEAGALGLIFLGAAALSLSSDHLPFAYIIMPPLLWAAVRFEFKGVAVTLTLLALITVVFTISGASQFAGDPESQKQKQVMLQLFLAISAFSALIVAAISRQHQQALLTLRDREQQLSQLVNMVPSHLWRLTPDGEPTFFNKRMVDFLGLDIADTERPGMSRLEAVIKTIHPDEAAGFRDALSRCLVTGEHFSMRYRLRRADGVYRWMSSRAEPTRDQGGPIVQWYGLCHDIDDQMRAEETLRRSERELSQLVDMVPSLLWRLTPDGEPIFFNKRMIDFFGLDVGDADKPEVSRLAAVIETVVHPDDAAELVNTLNRCIVTGERFSMKYRLRRADGVYRWMSGRAEPMRDETGTTLQWYGLAHDIDDEVRAQAALRERERELSLLVDMVPSHLWRLSPDGVTTLANKRMADFLGMDLADKSRLEVAFDTIFHPDDVEEVGGVLGRCLLTGERFSMKYRLRRADGVYRWMSGRAEPMRDESGRIVQWFGLCHDIDDQVHAEEALRRASDKLAQATQAASLAELSASIAHEVNQPLAAIVANSHACHRWLSAEPPNVERAKITVERITRDAHSAADVVSRIRALFKQSVETRTIATLPSVVAEARDLMADEATWRRVRVDIDVESDLPLVAFDRVQLQQILINLIRNGMDAMDSIAADRVLVMRVRRKGDMVQTEVIDRGRGLEFPDKIFEPFFTTKEHGMGMGLAICRSIVESHGGRLWAKKNEPHGTTFIFTLPVEMKTAP